VGAGLLGWIFAACSYSAEALRPDAIVMDVSMPVLDGIGAARRIKRRHPQMLIVALSFHEDEAVGRAMAEAGAAACLYKDGPGEDLVKTIRQAWLGRQCPGQPPG
jgi:two-component system nitrate/nitrite response regulator NarL